MDTAQLIERNRKTAEDVAKQFEAMAQRIRHNGDDKFGGALLLVPPDGVGEPVQILQIAGSNAGIFWSIAKQSLDEQFNKLAETAARLKHFGQA